MPLIIPHDVTKNRFVAFLDILGFKDIVNSEKHIAIYKKLSNIIDIIERQIKLFENKSDWKHIKLHYKIFSDSIILITEEGTEEALYLLIFVIRSVIGNSLSKKIPIKGAIAFGEMSIDINKSIFFGKPLINSYLLQEDLKYYGVVMHHTIDNFLYRIRNDQEFDYNELLFYTKTPFNKEKINYNNVNWYKRFEQSIIKSEDDFRLNDFYNTVSGSARIYVDNTLEMANIMKEKK